jgi:YVTN family beta-propeller protein
MAGRDARCNSRWRVHGRSLGLRKSAQRVLVALLAALFALPLAGTVSPLSVRTVVPPNGGATDVSTSILGGPIVRPAVTPVAPPSDSAGPLSGTSFIENLTVGAQPTELALDTQTNYLYVSDFGPPPPAALGNCATIINGTTNRVLKTIAVGDDPLTIEYDPADGYVYVNDYGVGHNITVISGLHTIASIPVGASPADGQFDPRNDELYVVNRVSDNLSVIQGTSVVATVATGQSPASDLYDPSNGYVYVANGASNNVTIINGTKVIASVGVGILPYQMAFDPANQEVFVADSGSGNLTVINGTTVVASIATPGSPTSVTFDPDNDYLYVPNAGANSVDVVSGGAMIANISVGAGPRFAAFDSADGMVYVDNWLAGNVSLINGTTLVASITSGPEPWEAYYDPVNHDVYAPEYGGYVAATGTSNLTVLGGSATPQSIQFDEVGLPAGENWSVAMGETTYFESGSAFTVDEPNGSYAYSVPRPNGYAPVPASGNVSLAGSNQTVTIHFAMTFPVDIEESGLGANTTWGLSMDGVSGSTTGTNLTLPEPNGTFSYRVEPVPGYVTNWTGAATIAGVPLVVTITFRVNTYLATFNETGLPIGSRWSVDLDNGTDNSTTTSVSVPLPNGTYRFSIPGVGSYAPHDPTGSLAIFANGTSIAVVFAFSYSLFFNESGLPPSINWTLVVEGGAPLVTKGSLVLAEPNGTYHYQIDPIPGYSIQWNGIVKIAGRNATVNLTFIEVTYALTFEANGLPNGTEWAVEVNGARFSSVSDLVVDNVPNGTFALTYAPAGAYAIANAPPPVAVVHGEGELVPVYFRLLYSLRFSEVGVPVGLNWSVTVVSAEFVYITEQTRSSTNATIDFDEPSGSYTYTFGPVPGFVTPDGGSAYLNGAPGTVDVAYSDYVFPVTFRESGLPERTPWNVTLDGVMVGSDSRVITGELTNGTHNYLIDPLPGYLAAWVGRVSVNGTPIQVNVSFALDEYAVTIVERGLPNGAAWSVEVGGKLVNGSSESLALDLPNGSYTYYPENVSGYELPLPGTVVVAGGPPGAVVVDYSATGTFGSTGVISSDDAIAGGLVVAAIAVSVGLLVRRSRRDG